VENSKAEQVGRWIFQNFSHKYPNSTCPGPYLNFGSEKIQS